jgi:hypothetical protein
MSTRKFSGPSERKSWFRPRKKKTVIHAFYNWRDVAAKFEILRNYCTDVNVYGKEIETRVFIACCGLRFCLSPTVD